MVVPHDPSQPLTVVEVQFQPDDTIYPRIVTEMAAVQIEHQMRAVQGIILFRFPDLDPQTQPWNQVVHAFLLRDLVAMLAWFKLGWRCGGRPPGLPLQRRGRPGGLPPQRHRTGPDLNQAAMLQSAQPEHPLVAVFQPVLLSNEQTLQQHAVQYYRHIKGSTLADPLKAALLEIFVSWLEQRFTHMSKQEIEAMFVGELPDLEETQSGKDLIAIGEKRRGSGDTWRDAVWHAGSRKPS